jgi:hypothetical protein
MWQARETIKGGCTEEGGKAKVKMWRKRKGWYWD